MIIDEDDVKYDNAELTKSIQEFLDIYEPEIEIRHVDWHYINDSDSIKDIVIRYDYKSWEDDHNYAQWPNEEAFEKHKEEKRYVRGMNHYARRIDKDKFYNFTNDENRNYLDSLNMVKKFAL